MFLSHRGTDRSTPDRARVLVRTDGGTAVPLDVREAPEGEAGHAPGAVRPPLAGLPAAGERGQDGRIA
ncbi:MULTISPECIES: hypothetical protein [Streptomyces]|uniref:Rhodanese domain-containing protein n=1 Tax=Streptomyces chilikensis TaxID=1194079 RepID=A0ABV3EK22_9ACTN|nr:MULTISPECIES: hypothetical protein [Streptomyces]MDH6223178.1 rhodanese-related sulfurtransferase [Streptomyces sp. MJP52]